MCQVVGVYGGWGRLPDNDVTDDGGCEDEVPTDGSEVKWGDGENETFERSVFDSAAWRAKRVR